MPPIVQNFSGPRFYFLAVRFHKVLEVLEFDAVRFLFVGLAPVDGVFHDPDFAMVFSYALD